MCIRDRLCETRRLPRTRRPSTGLSATERRTVSEPAAAFWAPQVGCLPTGTSSEEAAMKDAPAEPTGTTTGPAELPTNPPNGRTAGVDWAKDDHVVAVLSTTGTATT